MKMELTEGSETSAYINQTPGNCPKGNLLYSVYGESLKSRILNSTRCRLGLLYTKKCNYFWKPNFEKKSGAYLLVIQICITGLLCVSIYVSRNVFSARPVPHISSGIIVETNVVIWLGLFIYILESLDSKYVPNSRCPD